MAINRKPITGLKPLRDGAPVWGRLEGEGPKAYEYFKTYLTLDPRVRTFGKVKQIHGCASDGHIRAYAEKFRWKERIAAWEAERLRAAMAERERVLEEARQYAYDHLMEVIENIADLAKGEMPTGATIPIFNRKGEQIGEKPAVSAATRLSATRYLAEITGLVVPKRYEMDLTVQSDTIMAAAASISTISTRALRQILQLLKEDEEPVTVAYTETDA